MKNIKAQLAISRDRTKSVKERRAAFDVIDHEHMNPKPAAEFDPATFDPMEEHPDFDIARRPREAPPNRMPTMGMYPKRIKQGQLIGMFESPQDLYLMIAWLSNRVTDLEERLDNQQPQPPKRT